jgi:hypothetical protein
MPGEDRYETLEKFILRELSCGGTYKDVMLKFKAELLWQAITSTRNKSQACSLLRMHRNNFSRWIKECNLNPAYKELVNVRRRGKSQSRNKRVEV